MIQTAGKVEFAMRNNLADRAKRLIQRSLRRILRQKGTTLDEIIPGEIRDDEFYRAIEKYASSPDIKTILEIGSSGGGGSTRAFAESIQRFNPDAKLYCMEVSEKRFAELLNTYKDYDFVRPFNVSSVPLSAFPSEQTVALFYKTQTTNLNKYPLEMVLGWLRQDVAYVKEHGKDTNGIQLILEKEKLPSFDLVLIDGSEFTGRAELAEVRGAAVIMLDDINGYKNFENYQDLKMSPDYALAEENWSLRNGYAIFLRNR